MGLMFRSRWFAVSALAAFAAVPAISSAQYEDFSVGPSVGLFFPADGELRRALGNSWFSFGFGGVRAGEYRERMLGFNYNVISKSQHNNTVFILAGSYGLVQPLGDANANTRPYFAVRGGLAYMDYALDATGGNRLSGKKIGFNANAEFGVILGDRLTLAARYDLFSAQDGLSFNGLSLSLKYGLIRF